MNHFRYEEIKMGAFWHLFVPVEVSITMDKREFESIAENQIPLPEPFAKDFFESNSGKATRSRKSIC